MPVRDQSDAPAHRRPFPDPAAAILAFVGSSFLATFAHTALYLRWAWYGIHPDATGPDAVEKLRRARSTVCKTTKLLARYGLLSVVKKAALDEVNHGSVRLFSSEERSRLPGDVYESLFSCWYGHGGKVKVDILCLQELESEVVKSGKTRSEPRTAHCCVGAVILKSPETVTLSRELEAKWLEFRNDHGGGPDRPRQSAEPSPLAQPRLVSRGSRGWDVDAKWIDWPLTFAVAGSADHAKRHLAIGRCRSDGRDRVVVVPVLAYWPDAQESGASEEREAVVSLLEELLDDCVRKGQTLEVWAPVPMSEEGRANA